MEYMGDMDGVTSSKTKSFKGAIDDLGDMLALEPLVDATFANCKERAMSVLMRAHDEKLIKYDVDDKMNGTVWRVGPSVSNSPEVLERKSTDDTGDTTHLDSMESSTEKVSEQEHEGKVEEGEEDTSKELEGVSDSKEDLGSEEKKGPKGGRQWMATLSSN